MFFPFCTKIGIFAYWKINQKYIAENYCINRDKPQMHCDGKCQLMAQFAKFKKMSDPATPNVPVELLLISEISPFVFEVNDFPILQRPIHEQEVELLQRNDVIYKLEILKRTFHPPELS